MAVEFSPLRIDDYFTTGVEQRQDLEGTAHQSITYGSAFPHTSIVW
jgi:hypothetical protein